MLSMFFDVACTMALMIVYNANCFNIFTFYECHVIGNKTTTLTYKITSINMLLLFLCCLLEWEHISGIFRW